MPVTHTTISNQVEAIRYFIEKMDIEMVDAFLDKDKTYQSLEKYLFISKLQEAFITFQKSGDSHLIALEGRCNSCNKTKTGYTFVGNYSLKYMNIIFDVSKKTIKDIYECGNFKRQDTNLPLKERIYIDEDSFLPF